MEEENVEEKMNEILKADTNKSDEGSKSLGLINVAGKQVNIREVKLSSEAIWYNAYVEFKGSSAVKDDYISWATFRDGNIIGVDTMHSYNDELTQAEKLIDAIHQIGHIIERLNEVLKEEQ
jgi:hypothetical protein